MTVENIAICFSPCLLWAEERSIKDLIYATKSVRVVSLMLVHSEIIFGKEKDKKRLYRESYYKQKKMSFDAINIEQAYR